MATKHRTRWASLILISIPLGFSGGCSSYDGRYIYQPRPSVTVVQLHDEPGTAPLRMLSSIIGVRRATKQTANRSFVEAAILFDNTSSDTIAFDPASAALFAGDVRRFPDPDLTGHEKILIEPGEATRVTLLFPLSKTEQQDPLDLNGLNLRWAIEFEGQLYYLNATFDRRVPQMYRQDGYYAGYPGPYDDYFYHRHYRH